MSKEKELVKLQESLRPLLYDKNQWSKGIYHDFYKTNILITILNKLISR